MTATTTLTFHDSGQACDSVSVTIPMGNGTGSGATAANRIMTSGANTRHYTIWTPHRPDDIDGLGQHDRVSDACIHDPQNSNADFVVLIYGRVSGRQPSAVVGGYSDG
jgi:spore coat protein U-like protein